MSGTKLIPIDDLVRLVTEAGMQHQRAVYETSLTNLVQQDGDPFADLASAYELAHSLAIPQERLAEVIARRYPSVEDQLAAREHHDAVATTRAVAKTYARELENALRRALPTSRFRAERNHKNRLYDQPHRKVKWQRDYSVSVYLLGEREAPVERPAGWRTAFGLLGARTRSEVVETTTLLATVDEGNELVPAAGRGRQTGRDQRLYRGTRLYVVITVGSGVFIRLCTDVLDELRARFDQQNGLAGYDVVYDFVVE